MPPAEEEQMMGADPATWGPQPELEVYEPEVVEFHPQDE